jgi:hypothetical protein
LKLLGSFSVTLEGGGIVAANLARSRRTASNVNINIAVGCLGKPTLGFPLVDAN